MTKRVLRLGAVVAGAMLAQQGGAQMHKVAAPEEVVRAVGVYEWTGDMAKPAASRLIPVSLFIRGHLEDAGVYLARPVPFALDTGTVYEVDQAGLAKGLVDLRFARHLVAADLANTFDDGWFGYGTFRTPLPPKAAVKKAGRKETVRVDDEDSSRPTLHRKAGSEGDDASAGGSGGKSGSAQPSAQAGSSNPAPAEDPDRPHLTKRAGSGGDDSSSGTTSGAGSGSASGQAANPAPPDDPDRPHLTKRAGASGDSDGNTDTTASGAKSDSGTQAAGAGSGSQSGTSNGTGAGDGTASGSGTASADADRPTLKKRSPEEAKQARKESESSRVTGEAASLNDDPNRPHLQRGIPAHAIAEADFPKLKGVPESLHQMVAVSDAKTREPHNFAREWKDETEKRAVMTSLQALARSLLAGYGTGSTAAATTATAASTKAAATHSSTAHNNVRKKTVAVPPPLPLLDEDLKGYTLSYGGADTFVYMAHTDGDGAALRYVTVVAQKDALGELKPAIQSVTDAAHLDRTPWMRLVDVVDVEASNRASLLFELRGQNERQFGLYRVIAARAEQTLLTGTTQ